MNCRVCEAAEVKPFLDLGRLPLGNAFLKAAEFSKEKLYSLTLGFCEQCSLVQSLNPPPPAVLQADYRDYKYTPVGDSLRTNLIELGREVGKPGDGGYGRAPFVIDIGSNDGCLLGGAKAFGAKVLGIEPAVEIGKKARDAGIPTYTGFFDAAAASMVHEHGAADVVTCTQTLQHVPDPREFVRLVRSILSPTGLFVIEGRYFVDTVEGLTFDTIYHEMMSCFTLGSIRKLLELEGFSIERIERVDTYGGSLRVYSRPNIHVLTFPSDVEDGERRLGVRALPYYTQFAKQVRIVRDDLVDLVENLKAQGARIVGYGAPSTSATLLGYCGIGKAIDYIIDDNPMKQGLFAPGTHIPIHSFEMARTSEPDYIFLNAWQFKESIIKKTKHLGADYILPIPPQILHA